MLAYVANCIYDGASELGARDPWNRPEPLRVSYCRGVNMAGGRSEREKGTVDSEWDVVVDRSTPTQWSEMLELFGNANIYRPGRMAKCAGEIRASVTLF